MNHSDVPDTSLSREELYSRVWSTPMRRLAPHFGLSDVGLRKLCDRHRIPTPPRGYWAKQELGKAPRPTPLPAEAEPALQVVQLTDDPDPPLRPPATTPRNPVVTPELISQVERERDPDFRIVVADVLRNPHPAIQRTREAPAARPAPDQYNLRRPSWQGDAVDLAVGEPSIPRALRLMNALFLALEKRGWPVEIRPRKAGQVYERDRVRCTILGEEFGFRLREKMRMNRVPPEERWGIFDRQVRYEPKGLFELSISSRYGYAVENWRDGQKSRLEDRLNDVVVGLIVAVEKNWARRERGETPRAAAGRGAATQRTRESRGVRAGAGLRSGVVHGRAVGKGETPQSFYRRGEGGGHVSPGFNRVGSGARSVAKVG